MCISPEGYGSIASTYFLGASARVPARKSSRFAQCSCQRGSMAFGSYLSCKELPSSALILARCSSAAPAGAPGAASPTRTARRRQGTPGGGRGDERFQCLGLHQRRRAAGGRLHAEGSAGALGGVGAEKLGEAEDARAPAPADGDVRGLGQDPCQRDTECTSLL